MPVLPLSESLKDFLFLHDSDEKAPSPPLTPRAQAAHDFLEGSGQLLRSHNNAELPPGIANDSDTVTLSNTDTPARPVSPSVHVLPEYLRRQTVGLELQRIEALAGLEPLLRVHPSVYVRLHRMFSDARTTAELAAARERAAMRIGTRTDLLSLAHAISSDRVLNKHGGPPLVQDASLEASRAAAMRDIAQIAEQTVRDLAQAVDEVEIACSAGAIHEVLERLRVLAGRDADGASRPFCGRVRQ